MTKPTEKTFAEHHADRIALQERIEWIWLTIARWCNLIVAVALVVMAITGVAEADERAAREIKCLALNVYHEARGEPELGQLAVASVTINRANAKRTTICRTVYAPGQFSWTASPTRATDLRAWRRSVHVARTVWLHDVLGLDPVTSADHYHAAHVRPAWAGSMMRVMSVGSHRFYLASAQ